MNKKSKLIASLMVSTAVLGVAQIEASADTTTATPQQVVEKSDQGLIDTTAIAQGDETNNETQTNQEVADAPVAAQTASDEAVPADVISGKFEKTQTGPNDPIVDLENGASWTFDNGTLTISNGNMPALYQPEGTVPSPAGTIATYTNYWGVTQTFDYTQIKTIVFEGNVVFPENSSWMFSQLPNLESIKGNVDTSNVKLMQGMFWQDSKLNDLSAIENWDVSKVETLMTTFMQAGDGTLNINLSNWDTSNVKNFYATFERGNYNTVTLNGSFNTNSATDIHRLFRGATIQNLIGVEDLNTSNATDFDRLFENANIANTANGTKLDLTGWNTANVKNMMGAFKGSSFTELNLAGWNTSQVTNMKEMFSSANLEKLSIPTFDTAAAKADASVNPTDNIVDMFLDATNLSKINLGDKSIFDASVSLPALETDFVWQNTTNPDISKPTGETKYASSDDFMTQYNNNPAGWYIKANTKTSAYENKPEGKDIVVDQNGTVKPEDGIKNPEDLTGNPKFEFKGGQPDTSTPGDKQVTIVITYEDGSTDEITVTLHVKAATTPSQDAKTKNQNVLPNTHAQNTKSASNNWGILAPIAGLIGLFALGRKNQK